HLRRLALPSSGAGRAQGHPDGPDPRVLLRLPRRHRILRRLRRVAHTERNFYTRNYKEAPVDGASFLLLELFAALLLVCITKMSYLHIPPPRRGPRKHLPKSRT